MNYQSICKDLRKEAGMRKKALLPKGKLTNVILKRLGQMTKLVNNPNFNTAAFDSGIRGKLLPIMKNDPAYRLGGLLRNKLNSPALDLVGDPRRFYDVFSNLNTPMKKWLPAAIEDYDWLRGNPVHTALARLQRARIKRNGMGGQEFLKQLVDNASSTRIKKSLQQAGKRGIKGLESLLG